MDIFNPFGGSPANFLHTTIQLSAPIVFAALGGMFSERSGVINISLEGAILLGAFGAAFGVYMTGSPLAGLGIGMVCGGLSGLALAIIGVSLQVNQILAGFSINLLALGLTSFLSRVAMSSHDPSAPLAGFGDIHVPLLSDIPFLGPVLFQNDILIYGMVAVTVFSLWLLYRTPVGLIVTATGENPAAVDAAGISVPLVRYICVIAGSALAGIGGCYLVLTQIFMFSENMSAGKGFIALAAVILGRWNPVGVICACMCFALFDAWQLQLQFNNPEVPHQFFTMLPFLISFMAMVGLMGRSAAPRSLGLMFVRGNR